MSSSQPPVVLVTGASGLLGRSLLVALSEAGFSVVGSGRSVKAPTSAPPGVRWVSADLTQPGAGAALLAAVSPAAVVHSAAERRPDVCEAAAVAGAGAAAELINVDATWDMARGAARSGAAFLFISTDYVFDGNSPPYTPLSVPRPLNAYGAQKRRGELAVAAAHSNAVVLRVPVLYGPSADVAESAATVFARTVVAHAPASLDDWQVRVPTHTGDVAACVSRVIKALLSRAPGVAGATLHYSAPDRFTRFTLALHIGELLHLPTSHITGQAGPPVGAPRPHDATLDCSATAALGLFPTPRPFDEGMRAVLAGFTIDTVAGTIAPVTKSS